MNANWLGKYTITDIKGNYAKIKNSDDGKTIKCLINLSRLKPCLEFNKTINTPINILKNFKDCINKTYNIGPYVINKEIILSIDSWLDDQIINSYLYILINRYKNNCRYIDSYLLYHWKNSNYGKCKFNDDTNLVLMCVNINNSH